MFICNNRGSQEQRGIHWVLEIDVDKGASVLEQGAKNSSSLEGLGEVIEDEFVVGVVLDQGLERG